VAIGEKTLGTRHDHGVKKSRAENEQIAELTSCWSALLLFAKAMILASLKQHLSFLRKAEVQSSPNKTRRHLKRFDDLHSILRCSSSRSRNILAVDTIIHFFHGLCVCVNNLSSSEFLRHFWRYYHIGRQYLYSCS